MSATYQYLRVNSFLHGVDALTKMAWLLLLSVFAFLLGSPVFLLGQIVLLVLSGLILGRIPVRHFVRGTAVLWVLMAGIFFFQVLFQHAGAELFRVGPLPINSEGVRLGLAIGLRIALISVAALVFIWTTRPRDLIIGLVQLGLPYRLGYAILVAFQFVPLLESQAAVIRDAHSVRGVAEASGRIEAWRRYMFPMLAFGIRKAESAAIAMDARALGASSRRTFIDEFRWSRPGLVFLALFAALEIGMVVLSGMFAESLRAASSGIL
jgi:energy-coupling factor transport system permease protein